MFLEAAAVSWAQGRDEVLGCCSISQSLGPSQAGSAPGDSQAMRESSGISVPSGISTASQGQSLAFPSSKIPPLAGPGSSFSSFLLDVFSSVRD